MKNFKRIITLIVLSCALLACSSKSPLESMLGKELPLANFFSTNGERFSSKELFGKVSVVIFWAESCSLSRSVLKDLNELANDFKYKNRVNFLAVGLDEEKDYNKYAGFIQYHKIENLRHAFSGNAGSDEASMDWYVEGLPHFYVLSSDGKLVLHSHDFSDVEELLEERL